LRYTSSIFDALPEPLDEDVVHPAAPSVHADPDVVSLENSDKCVSGKLTALVGVEYLWRPVAGDRLFKGLSYRTRDPRVFESLQERTFRLASP